MQKTELPGIYKVSEGVLINRDKEALQKYKTKKQLQLQNQNKINTIEAKVENLVNDMEEIKSLLRKLTEK